MENLLKSTTTRIAGGLNMPHRGVFKGNVSAKGLLFIDPSPKAMVSMKTIKFGFLMTYLN